MTPYVHNLSGTPELDVQAISAIFAPDGLFAERLGGYEHRPQQQRMVEAVCLALSGKRFAIVEAGTGTGKSLAYLVPSIVWAVSTGEKVVISTNTINLQEQVMQKDLPFLARHVGIEFRAALVKGRANYLCLRRLGAWARQVHDGSADQAVLRALTEWAGASVDGSRSELPARVPQQLWRDICSEAESCLRGQCSHSADCFFMLARRAMEDANLLVVNHHLLFADIAVRSSSPDSASEPGILPPYRHLILDEAHNVEDVATDHLGHQVRLADINFLLWSLHRRKSDREVSGLAHGMLQAASGGGLGAGAVECQKAVAKVHTRLIPLIAEAREAAESLFRLLHGVSEAMGKVPSGGTGRMRLTPAVVSSVEWRSKVLPAWGHLCGLFGDLSVSLGDLATDFRHIYDEYRMFEESLIAEIGAAKLRVESVERSLEFVGRVDDEGFVYWVDTDGGLNSADGAAKAAPLDVGPYIKSQLCDRVDSIVFTSATLSVNRSFDFVKRSLGLDMVTEHRLLEARIGSPFDYSEQALLCIPNDIPYPDDPDYRNALPTALIDLVTATRGRALVLFTSYAMMASVYERVNQTLVQRGFEVLKQGERPRSYLLDRLKTAQRAVLLATDSFWEGVDVPGEALSCVILAKLPFRVPTDPVQEARYEAMEKRGQNPFIFYSLPQAVIKFKQGFGRLIRSRSDKGAVVVCDRRLTGKAYGRVFINSLPDCRALDAPLAAITAALEDWLR